MNSSIVIFIAFALCGIALGLPVVDDLKDTQAINEKLCQPGSHDDATAAKFFDCYSNVPGGKQYIECQNKVYGNPMDNEAHIDVVCTANKFPAYASCLMLKFAANFINPITAIQKLNACQGPIMGIQV